MPQLPYLLFAVLLLFFPRTWLRLGKWGEKRKHDKESPSPRYQRQPGDSSLWIREEFLKPRNYLDFFRASIGSVALMQFAFPGSEARPGVLLPLQLGLLSLAVLAQTLRYEQRILFSAPVFFLSGLAVGISGIEAALYGSASAWVLNVLLPNPSAFLIVQAFAIGAFGAFFHGPTDRLVLLAGFLNLLPVLVSFLAQKPLQSIGKRSKA